VAIGGLPLMFKKVIEDDVAKYKKWELKPVFVFNGLPQPLRKDKPFSVEDRRPVSRQQGWDYYSKGQVDNAYASWTSSGMLEYCCFD
jgi:hypothetical protein